MKLKVQFMLKDRELRAKLETIAGQQIQILSQLTLVLEEIRMGAQKQTAQGDEIVALIKSFDTELDRIAGVLDALNTRLLTATDEEDRQNINAEIARITARLKDIGKDPADPIPTE